MMWPHNYCPNWDTLGKKRTFLVLMPGEPGKTRTIQHPGVQRHPPGCSHFSISSPPVIPRYFRVNFKPVSSLHLGCAPQLQHVSQRTRTAGLPASPHAHWSDSRAAARVTGLSTCDRAALRRYWVAEGTKFMAAHPPPSIMSYSRLPSRQALSTHRPHVPAVISQPGDFGELLNLCASVYSHCTQQL